MGFIRNVNRPMGVLYKTLSGRRYTTTAYKGASFIELNENKSGCRNSCDSLFGVSFRRCYSVEVSEQMNLIKKLRQMTSAPIKDVKSALSDCSWDIEEAHKELRKRGVVLASKKSARTATEGLLALVQNEQKAAVIELNCETDFVARNEIFQLLAFNLAKLALQVEASQSFCEIPFGPDFLEGLKVGFDHPKISGEKTVQNAITEVSAMMGENIKLRRGYSMSASPHGVLSSYLHTSPQPGLGRIAGLLSLEVEDQNVPLDAVHKVGSEIAMHIVAAKPLFLAKEVVSSDAIDNELEVLKSQALSSGKPQAAIEKMVQGRLQKYFEDVVLMEQKFIVDDSVKIKKLMDNLSKEVGSPVKITNFQRIEVGEGIQRVETSSTSKPLAQAA